MQDTITHALVPVDETYNQRQLDLIKNTITKNLSDQEFSLLVEVAKRTGLDLFTRQIYGIKRGEQMTIQTGIDGYRLMAARTGDLGGIDDAVFDSEEGDRPKRATVTVWRFAHGQRVAFTATARWSEYHADSGSMWKKMPYLMLGKCAEALALRKAFPAELSGIYTHEEMDQAENDLPMVEAPAAPAPRPMPMKKGYATLPAIREERVEEIEEDAWATQEARAEKLGIGPVDFAKAKKAKYNTVARMAARLNEIEHEHR